MFQKILKYGIAIHAKSQSSSKNFYKSEIENLTMFHKIIKYGIVIQAKSQISSKHLTNLKLKIRLCSRKF